MKLNSDFVKALVARDLKRYFSNPTGYVFITLFIFLSAAAAFWQDRFFLDNLATLGQLNAVFPLLLLFFVPALTMSVWSEEKKQSTDELLFTIPATSWEVVLGKFLSTTGIYTVALALSVSHVLVLFWLGSPDLGVLVSNFIGYWLLGAAMISAGLLASLLTANTAIAFVLGAIFCGALTFGGTLVGAVFPAAGRVIEAVGVSAHFGDFARGVMSLGGILYFCSVAAFFLYLNMLVVDRRHWPKTLETYPTTVHYGLRGLGFLLALIGLNILFTRYDYLRADVTSEGLHSLSPETKTLIGTLSEDRPVFVQAFISPSVPEPYVQTRVNLLSTLHEIESVAGDKVQVLVEETVPFSAQARQAREKFGIVPRQIPNLENARAGLSDVFLGVAITCGAQEQVIPFLDRGLSPEYEITRGVRVVANTTRKKVGVLQTAINLFGGLDFQTMRSTPAWPVVEELKKQYEVVRLQPGAVIPSDLDGLLVVLPSSLPQGEMDTLAAAIQNGLPTLLLDDPLPVINVSLAPSEPPGGNTNPFMRNQAPQIPKGDIQGMLAKFGINWDSAKIVWDTYNPHPDLAHLPPEVVFVGTGNGNASAFSPDSPVTRPLQEMVFLYPGEVEKPAEGALQFRPLLATGKASGSFPYAQMVQRDFFGVQLNRDLPHRPDDAEYLLAAEVLGSAPGSAAPVADGSSTDPSSQDKAVRPVHVIFVPDIDFISDQFFEIRARGPQNLNFDNVSFFLNCIDALVGDESFIALRSKRVRHRTLERVEAQTSRFVEQRVKDEKQAEADADAALQEAQKRLEERVQEVQQREDLDIRTKQIMARNLQEAENRKFEVLKANIEAEKEARINASRETMEAQIRGIQDTIRTFAVLLPPIPVFVLGFFILVRRQRREREGAAAARRLRS